MASLKSEGSDTSVCESNVTIAEHVSQEDAISSVALCAGERRLQNIVLINPAPSLIPTLQATLFEIHPNVPIVASASDISQALTALRLLLLDAHPLARDNVECVVIASEGSEPRPRGVGCIQVAEERFPDIQGFQNMLTGKVDSQLAIDGQRCPRTISKMLIFPHFFPDIHDDRER